MRILEFNPQLAGQDITPANLEFSSVSTRRRERRDKSLSGVSVLQSNQQPLYSHQRSASTVVNGELIPLMNQSQSLDPYQSSVEYRLQELTKRLSTLETKLTDDVSSVLTILQRQFPTHNAAMASSAAEPFKITS